MAKFIRATVSQTRVVSCRHSSHAHDTHPPIISTINGPGAAPTERACTTAEPSANVAQARRPVTCTVEANMGI